MPGLQNAEPGRAATEKAQEGARLLGAGDYDGAIAACNEAIELYPDSIGARQTRAEAYRRLKAQAALSSGRQRPAPRNEPSGETIESGTERIHPRAAADETEERKTSSSNQAAQADNATRRADARLHAVIFLVVFVLFLTTGLGLFVLAKAAGIPEILMFLVVVLIGVLAILLAGRGLVDWFRESERRRIIEAKDVVAGLFLTGIIAFGMFWVWALDWGPSITRQRQAAWPTAQGTIVWSEGIFKNKWHPDKPTIARVVADFEYEVGGQSYSGHQRVDVGKQRQYVEEAEKKFSPGSAVTVYYNPKKRGEAVITPGGANYSGRELILLGYLPSLGGVGLTILGLSLEVFRLIKGRGPEY